MLFDSSFKEIFSAQIVSLIAGLFAGTLLAIYTDKLLLLPGILLLLPGFLELRGNISGSFASRLSSGLFLKVIHPNKLNTKIIHSNLFASFFLAIVICLVLGVITFLFDYFFMGIVMVKIILLPLIAGVIANGIEITLTLFSTVYFFKKGHDPNNIMGPLITSTGDITSIISLFIALAII